MEIQQSTEDPCDKLIGYVQKIRLPEAVKKGAPPIKKSLICTKPWPSVQQAGAPRSCQ